MNTNECPITYHCTVIEETVTAHSVKEFTEKLAILGLDENSTVSITAEVSGIAKKKVETSPTRRTVEKMTVEMWHDEVSKNPSIGTEIVGVGFSVTDKDGLTLYSEYRGAPRTMSAPPNIVERFLYELDPNGYPDDRFSREKNTQELFTKILLRTLDLAAPHP